MSAAQNTTTHIASLITAWHAKPIEIITPPTDGELFDKAFTAYAAVRWPDPAEDTEAVMNEARDALRELFRRAVTRDSENAALKVAVRVTEEQRCRAVDAFDEQSEEVERLRGELGR